MSMKVLDLFCIGLAEQIRTNILFEKGHLTRVQVSRSDCNNINGFCLEGLLPEVNSANT